MKMKLPLVRFLALLALATSPCSAPAQEPPQAPRPIEIYYGARKVVPQPKPEAKEIATTPQTNAALVEALHSFRDGTKKVSAATVNWLGRMNAQAQQPQEPGPLRLTSLTEKATQPPAASGSWFVPKMPEAEAKPAPQPMQTIVVMREPALIQEPPHGWYLSTELIICILLAAISILLIAVVWTRDRTANQQPYIIAQAAPQPVAPLEKGLRLLDHYDIGAKAGSAERFEVGPSYQDEQKLKHLAEEANQSAIVEQILNQNLILLAEIRQEPEQQYADTGTPPAHWNTAPVELTPEPESVKEPKAPIVKDSVSFGRSPAPLDSFEMNDADRFVIRVEQPKFTIV